jgi:hypothetical protein
MRRDLLIMFVAFVLASALAAALGAKFGPALAFGQMAFALSVVVVMVKR